MGFFSDLFSVKPEGSEMKAVRKDIYTPEQKKLIDVMAKQFQTGLEGPQPQAPAMSVPTTGSEQDYLDWARTDALKYAKGGLPYEVGDEYVDKFMQAYRPIWQRERDEAMDLARSEYAGPTYWGSARAEALSDIGSEWGEKFAMTEADLRLKQDAARRTAIDQYIGVGTEGLTTAGALERGTAQEKVMEDLNRFLMGEEVGGVYNPAYNPNIALAMSLLGYTPYTYASEGKEWGAGGLRAAGLSFLGGYGQGMGAKSALRYKENIQYTDVEVLPNVHGVLFNYKEGLGLPQGAFFGVLAEDLLNTYPHLVVFDSQGRPDQVRYDLLGGEVCQTL